MAPFPAPDFASPQFKANPYPLYARLRAEAPVYRRTRAVFWHVSHVTRYDDVLRVLKDERLSKEWAGVVPWPLLRLLRPIARNMLSLDPPDHTRLRGLVNKAFTPRLVDGLRGRVQQVCDELLDTGTHDGQMDLVRSYALPIPLTIIADLLGIPSQDRARFYAWSKSLVAGFFTIEVVPALPALWRFHRYLRELFARRRADPQDDLISALVQAEEAGDMLSEQELSAMVIMLLIAGYETTVHLIASGALALLQNPEQAEGLRQNPALADSAVEELLRFTSPLDFATPRVAREDLTVGTATIPRGDIVLAILGSANRDESQFPNPETLDITREPNRHLAFGIGGHFCLGAPLARLEGQIALPTLLRRFPTLRLAAPAETLRWRRNLFLRGLEELPVYV